MIIFNNIYFKNTLIFVRSQYTCFSTNNGGKQISLINSLLKVQLNINLSACASRILTMLVLFFLSNKIQEFIRYIA